MGIELDWPGLQHALMWAIIILCMWIAKDRG